MKDKTTPLRQYLQVTFPNPRRLQQEYKAHAGELIVGSSGAPPATVGTAVDLMIRFLLDPTDVPLSARILFPFPAYVDVVDDLARIAGNSLRDGATGNDAFARAVWGLALCVEAHRAGPLNSPFVSELFIHGGFDVETMLAQATPAALVELAALRTTAEQHLIRRLDRPFHLGPEFDASTRDGGIDRRLIAAEADLICDGLLLDIKTQLGGKNSVGVRKDTLSPDHLYQLIAYALLDYSDTYGINRLGLYSARYGGLHVWSLHHVTSTMAGEHVNFRELRQEIWDMLHK
ncbi:hypothetical protein QN357_01825 [Cryobacterium sp. RTC2.1]|nr:hypothetical protein [Cryobacterium sp. RTC2.1]